MSSSQESDLPVCMQLLAENTQSSPGIPCVFYAEWFVLYRESEPTTLAAPLEDLEKIGRQVVRSP